MKLGERVIQGCLYLLTFFYSDLFIGIFLVFVHKISFLYVSKKAVIMSYFCIRDISIILSLLKS
jgi:hypothetical protein